MPGRMSQCGPREEEEQEEQEEDGSERKAPSSGARLWDRVRSRLLRPKVKPGSDRRCLRSEPFLRLVFIVYGRLGVTDSLYSGWEFDLGLLIPRKCLDEQRII